MRRKDREVTAIGELLEIIGSCKVCRIAITDKDGPYIVPMNFGYEYSNDVLTLYFHSAKEGRKIDALRKNGDVCFEMDCAHRLVEANAACSFTYSYKSIVGNGTAAFVHALADKKKALSLLVKHQTGKAFAIDDKMVESVAVFKVVASSFTGKYHK